MHRSVSQPALKEFMSLFENKIAPLSLAEKWDNVGFILEAPNAVNSVNELRVRTCIDMTMSVVAEAVANKDNLIVTYHPQLFSATQSLSLASHEPLLTCAFNGISVFSPHTALDSVDNGINDAMLTAFEGLEKSREACSIREDLTKIGRVVMLEEPIHVEEAVKLIKKHLGLSHVRVANPGLTHIKSVAVCAGAGVSVVKGVNADLYWTGEMSHHDVLACLKAGKVVVLCEHTNTERFYLPILAAKLNDLGVQSVSISEADKEPLMIV